MVAMREKGWRWTKCFLGLVDCRDVGGRAEMKRVIPVYRGKEECNYEGERAEMEQVAPGDEGM